MNLADIRPERKGSFTEYTITGAFKPVCDAIEAIFKQYHPLGYGTKVQSLSMDMSGSYTAQMWRANSCD